MPKKETSELRPSHRLLPTLLILTALFAFHSQEIAAQTAVEVIDSTEKREEAQEEEIKKVPIADDLELEILTPQQKNARELLPLLPEDASASDLQLQLVNRDHPLSEEVQVNLVDVGHGQKMDARAQKAMQAWFDQAQRDGYPMQLMSGYRSFDLQQSNYQQRLQAYQNNGASEDLARMQTEQYIMPAGASEHHTGLAMDLVSQAYASQGGSLDTAFANQPAYDYYLSTMADYGFILRYLEGRENITGVQFEPWHFRYVGQENAKFMTDHDLTLEEYIDLLNSRDQQFGE